MGRLNDKTAIITGGAAGIGYETLNRFVNEGAKVAFTDVDEEKGKKVESEFNSSDVLFIKQDVSKEEDWQKVVQTTQDTFGHIDILFNNAGIYKIKNIVDVSLEEWNQLMGINVTGVFLGMKHTAPAMAENGGGSIINASSIAGITGASGHIMYGASKGAVRTMTKDIAAEYSRQHVRVNSIHPGYITTQMSEYASEQTGLSKEELDEGYPLGRMGNVGEVADTVLFLASEESSFITASEVTIDGGATNIQ